MLLLGLIAQDNLTSQLSAPSWLWAPIVVFCICVAAGLVVSGIKPSATVQVVMGVFEMAVFSVLSVWLIIKAGSRNTLSVFSPTNGNANGWGSILAAMIYGVLAFAGFESAAFLAEEARESRRAVRRALIGSVVVSGFSGRSRCTPALCIGAPTPPFRATGLLALESLEPRSLKN